MVAETITPRLQRKQKQPSAHPSGDKRFRNIDLAMKRNNFQQDALIEVLHKAQSTFGYLEDDVLIYIARKMKLPLSLVYGVATFYHLFSLKPQGEHNCVVCLGTACYVKGSGEIQKQLEQYLGIKTGETTPDGKVSLLTARCFGVCGLAPAITIDGKVSGQETSTSVLDKVKKLITEVKK
jgi:bidirectional [NiFe] hydrogenase diaphorase subunit